MSKISFIEFTEQYIKEHSKLEKSKDTLLEQAQKIEKTGRKLSEIEGWYYINKIYDLYKIYLKREKIIEVGDLVEYKDGTGKYKVIGKNGNDVILQSNLITGNLSGRIYIYLSDIRIYEKKEFFLKDYIIPIIY